MTVTIAMHNCVLTVNAQQTATTTLQSLINSRVRYGVIAWGRAASCHLHPITD